MREFPVGDAAGRREERVLTSLDGLAGLAPQLLASDTAGAARTLGDDSVRCLGPS